MAVEEEIEIDGAGSPLGAADAGEVALDLEHAVEQAARRVRGLKLGGGVKKRGGIGWHAFGGIFEEGGELEDFDAWGLAEEINRGMDGLFALAGVGAQGDEGGNDRRGVHEEGQNVWTAAPPYPTSSR